MARYKNNKTGQELFAYRIGDEPIPFWARRFSSGRNDVADVSWLLNHMDGSPIVVIHHRDGEMIKEFEGSYSLVEEKDVETANVNPKPGETAPDNEVKKEWFDTGKIILESPVTDTPTDVANDDLLTPQGTTADDYVFSLSGMPPVFNTIPGSDFNISPTPQRRSNEEVTTDINSQPTAKLLYELKQYLAEITRDIDRVKYLIEDLKKTI